MVLHIISRKWSNPWLCYPKIAHLFHSPIPHATGHSIFIITGVLIGFILSYVSTLWRVCHVYILRFDDHVLRLDPHPIDITIRRQRWRILIDVFKQNFPPRWVALEGVVNLKVWLYAMKFDSGSNRLKAWIKNPRFSFRTFVFVHFDVSIPLSTLYHQHEPAEQMSTRVESKK